MESNSFRVGYDAAVRLGTEAHAGKNWYAGKPYTEHLLAVERVITRYFDYSPSICDLLMIAAWLHDAVEDTGMSLDLIEKECGPKIRELVWAVTDEPGINRKERHEKTYPKIRNVYCATALKLADRIANVEASYQARGSFYDMYRKEQYDFKRALYVPGQYEELWQHLDEMLSEDPSKQATKLADKLVADLRRNLEGTFQEIFFIGVHKRFATIIHAEFQTDAVLTNK